MRDDIDNFLEKKYENVAIPDGIFDFEEIFKKGDAIKKRRRVIKNVASIAAVFVVVIVTITILLVRNNANKVLQHSERDVNNEVIGYVKEINVKNTPFELGEPKNNDYVYSIKQTEILEQSIINENNETYPITKIKAEVLDVFKGEELSEIILWVPGGIWTVSDLKNTDFLYNSAELESLKAEDNIYLKYYETYQMAMPVNGNTYLITLKKDNDEFYVEKNAPYGFKEYNTETNSIKKSDGTWKEVNIEEYLK